jgi:hypothetical protein
MYDDIVTSGEPLLEGLQIKNILTLEAVVRVLEVPLDVALLDRGVVEGVKVVERGDSPAVFQKAIDEMAADKAGTPGDQHATLTHPPTSVSENLFSAGA